jgi:hypothetical protein
VAIFMFLMPYEIASVVLLPRIDIMTQSGGGGYTKSTVSKAFTHTIEWKRVERK